MGSEVEEEGSPVEEEDTATTTEPKADTKETKNSVKIFEPPHAKLINFIYNISKRRVQKIRMNKQLRNFLMSYYFN